MGRSGCGSSSKHHGRYSSADLGDDSGGGISIQPVERTMTEQIIHITACQMIICQSMWVFPERSVVLGEPMEEQVYHEGLQLG